MPLDRFSGRTPFNDNVSKLNLPKKVGIKEHNKTTLVSTIDLDRKLQEIENAHSRIVQNNAAVKSGAISKQIQLSMSRYKGIQKKNGPLLPKKKIPQSPNSSKIKAPGRELHNVMSAKGVASENIEKSKMEKDLIERKKIIKDLKLEHDSIVRDKTILLMEMKNMRKYLDEVKTKLDRSMLVLSKPCKVPKTSLGINVITDKKLRSSAHLLKYKSSPKKRPNNAIVLKVPSINIDHNPKLSSIMSKESHKHPYQELKNVLHKKLSKNPTTQYYVNPNTVSNLFESIGEHDI